MSLRIMCLYDKDDSDTCIGAAVIKYWYIYEQCKNSNYVNIKTLDEHPELNDPSFVLMFKKFDSKWKGLNMVMRSNMIMMLNSSVRSETMLKLAEDRSRTFVWFDNRTDVINENEELVERGKTDLELRLVFQGLREPNVPIYELIWRHFFPSRPELKLNTYGKNFTRPENAYQFLLTEINKQELL